LLKNNNIRVRFESVSFTLEEFVLELDPMESKAMKETLKHIQDHENTEGNRPECRPKDDSQDYCRGNAVSL